MMAAGGAEEGGHGFARPEKPRPSCVAVVPFRRMYELYLPWETERRILVGPHWFVLRGGARPPASPPLLRRRPMLVLTYAIFTVPTVMIWVKVLPYCSWTIRVCSVLVYLFTIGSLTMTAFIDPGVVTRCVGRLPS